ncbi:MAG: hypothetical protein ACTHOF_13985 [Flavisolibacter sp.]
MSPSNNTTNGKPSWIEIKKAVLDYQAYLRKVQPDPQLRRKAFLLDKETIERLLLVGAGKASAIRFYIGSEPNGSALRLFPVACERKTDATGNVYYEDINIPKTLPDETTTETTADTTGDGLPEPCDTRPCPIWCSTSNFLNP